MTIDIVTKQDLQDFKTELLECNTKFNRQSAKIKKMAEVPGSKGNPRMFRQHLTKPPSEWHPRVFKGWGDCLLPLRRHFKAV
jgi:hypothetical protein